MIASDRLRASVVVTAPAPCSLVFEGGAGCVEVTHEHCSAQLAVTLSELRSVRGAAAAAGVGPAFGEELARALAEHGVLIDERLTGASVPFDIAEAFLLERLDRWCDDIYYDGLWDPLLERRGQANLLYGWIVENYHYTLSVNEHLGSAIGNTRRGTVGRRFVQHLAEEWDHPHLFLNAARALTAAGGVGQPIEESRPLGSTRAVTLHLKRATKVHPFVYKTCAAVLERTANRVDDTRRFYRRVAEVQGLPPSAVEPLILHAEADERFAHLSSLAEFLGLYPVLAAEVVREAADYARVFVDLLHLWQRDIADHYGRFPLGDGARL
jgi:hypothetical protein